MVRNNSCGNRVLRVGLAIFLLLSITDFMITWKLVAASNTEVDEVNPLASWILQQFGWIGLATFKAALVSFIAASIVIIRLRRKSMGEAVLTFGCGAQASVVVTSLLLLHGSKPNSPTYILESPAPTRSLDPGAFLPIGGFAMLTHESVQKELELTGQTIKQIEIIMQKRREIRQRFRTENIVEIFDLYHHQYGQERLLGASLSPRQLKRLTEICFQARGGLAFYDQTIMAQLEFSEAQVENLRQMRDERQFHNAVFLKDKSAQNLAEVNDQLLVILDATQRQRWQAMQGEPFAFESQAATLETNSSTSANVE